MIMEFPLKPISKDAIPAALERVERYRLLNEPWQAESICEDILQIDPDNQDALRGLLLALTDQFGATVSLTQPRSVIPKLQSPYERAYYEGIIYERAGHAEYARKMPESAFVAYEYYRKAMALFEEAQRFRPGGNDDSILRWNTCARTLMRNKALRPRPEEVLEPVMGE
jgi:tetratricopeptide (TPR) repeat protein